MALYGALEAGGTKMVLAIVDDQGRIRERVSLPTREPEETVPEMVDFFRQYPIGALGIGWGFPRGWKRTSTARPSRKRRWAPPKG